MVKVAPSILSVNIENLESSIKEIETAGADYIHIDVMDGKFVNNETPGLEMLEKSNDVTEMILDTHLMVENPEDWLEDFSLSDIITFHVEAVDAETADRMIENLHECDIKVGLAIKPNTPIEEVLPYIEKIDMVLVMLVEPGFGGQQMIEECLEKVRFLRDLKPEMDIEVDGGINLKNIQRVKDAGANVIVAGTAIFSADDKKYVIKKIKE